jgi:GAF domain-containing protein
LSQSQPAADELADVFARMSGLLLSDESIMSVLRLVTSLARETLPAALGAGVTLLDRSGRRTTAAASDPIVAEVDAVQYQLDEGPCLTAWAERAVVRVDDVTTERRWPRWTVRAAELGMCAVLSAGLIAGEAVVGAIKVYASEPGVFTDHDEHVMSLFAAQAAVLVANMQAYDAALRLSEELKSALRGRDTIAMAKGVLIARDGADEGTALTTLATLAARRKATLRDTAAATVRSAVRRPVR